MALYERTIRTPLANVRISQSSGRGLPILMIHGSGASRAVFARQLESPLADHHRMIAFDLPGHGDSSDARDPETGYTVRGLAEAAAWVLEGLDIRRAVVFGWSLGGHVAIQLASYHPAVAGLLLTGTPPVSKGPIGMLRGFHANWDMLLASKRSYSDRDAQRFEKLCFGETADRAFRQSILRADGRLRAIAIRSMMSDDGADQRRVVEDAAFPIAMVNGADDPFIRLSYLETLHYRTLWGRCIELEGVGHAPFWERPDLFNPILTRFVEACVQQESQRTATPSRHFLLA